MAGWLKLLHVVVAIGFIVGLVGRTMAFRFARRATTVPGVEPLLELSDWFDTRLVIPGSLLVLFSGSWAAIQGRWGLLTASGRPTWVLMSLALVMIPIPLIPTVLIPRRKARAAALRQAREAGRLTPELREALDHPAVLRVRTLELVVVAIVLGLMVLKPT